MLDAKRKEISQKINAAEHRNRARAEPKPVDRAGEKAIEAKDRVMSFARKHPIATVAGGLAVGIAVSALFRGSLTRKAGRTIGKKTAGLAALAAELAVGYAQQAFEAAGEARRAGADKMEQRSGSLGDGARSLGEDARGYAADAAAAAREAGRAIRSCLN